MKESEIRPKEIHKRYLELSLKDAQKMDAAKFVEVMCVACGSSLLKQKFKKNNFNYVQCTACGTVYCSPRPTQEQLDAMYIDGESSHYWANVFFPAVAEARREKLFRKKAQDIENLLPEFKNKEISICDVGAGYGIFLEELRAVFPNAKLCAIEPGKELAKKCREKGFETLEVSGEQAKAWGNRFHLVISSEVIEHVFDPFEFISSLFALAKPNGGNVLITGLGYEGFDNLILQERSNSIFPPHHLNFLSINGFERLFKRAGFSQVKVWTPGILDADIVLNSESPPEFLKVLAKREGALKEFQEFLSKHNLSSHTWVLAKK